MSTDEMGRLTTNHVTELDNAIALLKGEISRRQEQIFALQREIDDRKDQLLSLRARRALAEQLSTKTEQHG